jgi:hypothetical protein
VTSSSTPIERVLDRLQKVRRNSEGWAALCPAHDDHDPSLSVSQGKDGKVLIKCHAGCDIKHVLEAMGLKLTDLYVTRGKARKRPQKLETRYEVRDGSGCLVALHVREDRADGKRFWWERPTGEKGLGGLPVTDLPLYGAETLLALPDNALVVLTEGEKAKDALTEVSVNAVGTVTGANATPTDAVMAPLLRFRIVLWPDFDDPGRKHMARIAARLWTWGHSDIHLVDWQEAPPAGDAADAVAQGADVEGLLASASCWRPPGVDLAALLDDIRVMIRRYVVLAEDQLSAVALWVVHTYAFDAAECTPYLEIYSPEKRSGKTRLLEVLNLLVAKPWLTGRVTAAVLVRKIARDRPTLLLDESDAAFKGEKEYAETLRAVLNSGYRRGGVASLCVKQGGDFELKDLPVFGPKALAGIGKLPDTIRDRAIPIELRRKAPGEHVERLRLRDAQAESESLREGLEEWASLAVPTLERARPEVPNALDDRAADVWEPLLAIADSAWGQWPARARTAALALSAGATREDDSLGVTLLRDIRVLFQRQGVNRMSTAELLAALLVMEEAPWGDLWGRPLDTRRLAKILRPYGIRPHVVRIGERTPSGYDSSDFGDAWNRYLPSENPQQAQHPQHFNGFDKSNVEDVEDVEVPTDIEHLGEEVTEWTG